MAELSGFPYFPVQFTKDGQIFDENEVSALLNGITEKGITDLIVVSHGWKNDIADATALYTELVGNIRAVLDSGSAGGLPGRTLGIVGVFWPSKKWTPRELQPGGGASLSGTVTEGMLEAELDTLQELSDRGDAAALIARAKDLVIDLEDRKSAQDEFVNIVRQLLADDTADSEVDDEMPAAATTKSGRELIDLLSRPRAGDTAGGDGGEAGFGSFFAGIRGGAMNFLDMTTYWKMKQRAGKVGRRGMHEVLERLKAQHPGLNVHLVGHSFGGRVMAAAVRGPDDSNGVPVKTLSLLQAAFSHNGFAEKFDGNRDGYFRKAITNGTVSGPILITHTANDNAVGVAYPLASRINRDDAAAFGDENDRFGGIGRNGAQHTPGTITGVLQGSDGSYIFEGGKLYNLKADDFIADHGDVKNRAVANMILNGMAAA
jgi:hypothetical protein